MEIFTFGDYIDGKGYKVLDERRMRASAGIMFLLAMIAFVNGFIVKRYAVIPYISGFLVLNFMLGIFINPKFSPTLLLGTLFVRKQSPLPIGAVQKKFAWTLGLMLATGIFILSMFLLNDESYFRPVCVMCELCLLLLFLETAFGICVGCKLYDLAIYLRLLKKPAERPNCTGDGCKPA